MRYKCSKTPVSTKYWNSTWDSASFEGYLLVLEFFRISRSLTTTYFVCLKLCSASRVSISRSFRFSRMRSESTFFVWVDELLDYLAEEGQQDHHMRGLLVGDALEQGFYFMKHADSGSFYFDMDFIGSC